MRFFCAQFAKHLWKRKMFRTENADKIKRTFYVQYTYPVNLNGIRDNYVNLALSFYALDYP